jgi:hypothetical protein
MNMHCINEQCMVCQLWGTEIAHCSNLSSLRMKIFLQDASKGVLNLTLKTLVIKETLEQSKFLHLTKQNFPKLENVDLFWVNVNQLPDNENVTSVILRCCHYERFEPYKDNDFPFPMAKSLVLISMTSKITKKSRLPMLKCLQHLEIRNCSVDDKLSSNKFPALRSLVLEGVSVCKNIQITRLKRLHRVVLIDVEKLPRKNNWKGVNMLSLSKVCAIRLSKLVDIESFPKLAVLYVDCTEDVVIELMMPHPKLRKLSIRTTGDILGIEHLSSRYPMLVQLSLEGKFNKLETPDLKCLKRVKIVPNPKKTIRRNWKKKCQKIELFNDIDMNKFKMF